MRSFARLALAFIAAASVVVGLPTTATAEVGVSAPSNAPGGAAGKTVTVTFLHENAERSYRLFRPNDLPAGPRPVLVALHGENGGADVFEWRTGLDKRAVKAGALVIYPAARETSWRADSDDVAFLSAVLDDAAGRWPIDAARTALAGFSTGAFLAFRYGCERADRIDMMTIVGGTFTGPTCNLSRPVSMLQVHGQADTVVPVAGTSYSSLTGGALPALKGPVGGLMQLDGCTGKVTATWTTTPLVRNTYGTGCPAGTTVDFVVSDPLPHVWPTGSKDLSTYGVDATNMTWSVTTAHWSSAGPARVMTPSAPPSAGCDRPAVRHVAVDSAAALHAALTDARPGDRIQVADGRYAGRFVASVDGTAEKRIALCGTAAAVLDAGSVVDPGYVLHHTADYWDIGGLTFTNGQKGVMLDGASHNVLDKITVHTIGDEGIHFRRASTDNVLRASVVHDTGKRIAKYGEGVYIGSAVSNWCTYTACAPDRSDRNTVDGVRIYRTTSEAVDIKEGTTGGELSNSEFDGTGSSAVAWVNVKGNDWLIRGNSGRISALDGFRTEVQATGWAVGNVFAGNSADVQGPGFGYNLHTGNALGCDNTASGAGSGLSTLLCSELT